MKNFINKIPSVWKIAILSVIFFFVILGGFNLFKAITAWFDQHEIAYPQVLTMKWEWPVKVTKRKITVIELAKSLPEVKNLTSIEEYICQKFGPYDCKMALAISRAENGTRQPDRFHINDNGSIDLGIFQINSIHFKQNGCTLKEIVDAYKNVDCAYGIFKSSGWNAWSTFNNNAYLSTY